MTTLELALDQARVIQAAKTGIIAPDISEGLAFIFEDNPSSKVQAIVTVAFAKKFCAEEPMYCWRQL
jgi:hypothetical protein